MLKEIQHIFKLPQSLTQFHTEFTSKQLITVFSSL